MREGRREGERGRQGEEEAFTRSLRTASEGFRDLTVICHGSPSIPAGTVTE